MKARLFLSIAAALVIGFTATSCEDYLDKAPDSDITEADAFGNFTAFQGFIEQVQRGQNEMIVEEYTEA